MSLNKAKRDKISEVAKKIMISRLESFPQDGSSIRNAPFHDAFLEYFAEKLRALNIETPYMIALASWLHGLNGSLGSGFENIAHILSDGYKKNYSGAFVLKIEKQQADNVEKIIRELKGGYEAPSLERENKLVLTSTDDITIESLPFTADVYIETDDGITAIEMKSVRPNSGEGRGEKQKILYAKAALKLLHPDKTIKYYIGFPFDPTATSSYEYDKDRFLDYLVEFKKFFAKDEILISSELWDFLSGQENTMQELIGIITDTVEQVRGYSSLK